MADNIEQPSFSLRNVSGSQVGKVDRSRHDTDAKPSAQPSGTGTPETGSRLEQTLNPLIQ